MRTYIYGNKYHPIVKRLLQETSYAIAIHLIEANVERILNVLEAIEFAAGRWNSFVWMIIRSCWIKSESIEAPHIAACTK